MLFRSPDRTRFGDSAGRNGRETGCFFLAVGQVERESGEDRAPNKITNGDRYLVPDPPIGEGGFSAKENAGRNEEHIYDRMLKSLSEENENRKPGTHDFAEGRLRSHRHHYSEANHPVTEYRLYKAGEDAEPSELSVPQCLCIRDGGNFRSDSGG